MMPCIQHTILKFIPCIMPGNGFSSQSSFVTLSHFLPVHLASIPYPVEVLCAQFVSLPDVFNLSCAVTHFTWPLFDVILYRGPHPAQFYPVFSGLADEKMDIVRYNVECDRIQFSLIRCKTGYWG